jgi:branched-chain amino acid transport system permease protein
MTPYAANLLIFCCIYGVLAVSLDLLIGETGVFSAAHAVFFAVGAYSVALVQLHWTQNFLVAVLTAVIAAGVIGGAFALSAVRSREITFIVASLAFGVVFVQILNAWIPVTGGEGGLSGILAPSLFGHPLNSQNGMITLAVVALVVVIAIRWLIGRSRFGLRLRTIREDETAAISLGSHTAVVKAAAVVVSSMLASLGGVVYAYYVAFISPASFDSTQSVLLAAMVVIGGLGRVLGPVIGAALLTVLPSLLAFLPIPPVDLGPLEQMIYGAAVVAVMMAEPGGIAEICVKVYQQGVRVTRAIRSRQTPHRPTAVGSGGAEPEPTPSEAGTRN